PVEVNASGGKVVVSGMGVAPDRQRQIHRLFDPMPNVAIQFSNPPAANVPDSPGAPAVSNLKQGSMQARVEQQLGGRAQFARFSTHLLDQAEAAMSRAYALR